MDNHLSDGVYPVLLGKTQQAEYSSGHGDPTPIDTPFLEMTIIQEVNSTTNTAHYNYVALRCNGWWW